MLQTHRGSQTDKVNLPGGVLKGEGDAQGEARPIVVSFQQGLSVSGVVAIVIPKETKKIRNHQSSQQFMVWPREGQTTRDTDCHAQLSTLNL